jgi:hypothetical protein
LYEEDMIAYENALTNYSGVAFPDISAKNITAPAAGDGTEWIAAWANNQMGVMQAVLNYVGFVPNGVDESASNSQFLSALKGFVPAGTVVAWHGAFDMSTVPGGRWLPLEGQVVLINDYIDLVGNCYIGDANNPTGSFPYYYKSSDSGGAIRDIAGPYFKLADSRGVTLRGIDTAASRDPQGASRSFPDYQSDAVAEHTHEVVDPGYGAGSNNLDGDLYSFDSPGAVFVRIYTNGANEDVTTLNPTGTETDVETRAKNIQVKFSIRY